MNIGYLPGVGDGEGLDGNHGTHGPQVNDGNG